MYETRQNKEKTSRILFSMERKLPQEKLKANKYIIDKRNVVQKLNTIPAVVANYYVIKEMNENGWATRLLSGWGNVWIKGHVDKPTQTEQDKLKTKAENRAGDGNAPICHTCEQPYGNTMVVDHQPPKVLASGGYAGGFRFYPQCKICSDAQMNVVNEYKLSMKRMRQAADDDWATNIPGKLFWN